MKLIRNKYEKLIPQDRLYKETNKDIQYNFLKSKIQEELDELQETDFSDLGEWADLHEVLFAMQQFKNINSTDVREAQLDKAERLGGFDEFLILKQETQVNPND